MNKAFCKMMLKVLEADRFEDMSHQHKPRCNWVSATAGGVGPTCRTPPALEHPEFGLLCRNHYVKVAGAFPEEDVAWFEFDQCWHPGCELVIHIGKYCRRHCTRKHREADLAATAI